MIQIDQITDYPKQIMYLIIDGYDRATLTLEFRPNQFSWFFSLAWDSFALNNERVVFSHNILRQYSNILPFGIAVDTDNEQDPCTIDAFSSGSSRLFQLSVDEVNYFEALAINGQ